MKINPKLAEYFTRIGYNETASVTLATLRALQLKHIKTIPFENLNPFLQIPVLLDSDSLHEKMLLQQRGGYCFEQNLLFLQVLNSLGFSARGLTARVAVDYSLDNLSARTHLLLLVRLDEEEYLCDVGFGGHSPTAPLLLKTNQTQATPLENYRIIPNEQGFILQIEIHNQWRNLYLFDLSKTYPMDYKAANWYTATHPDSHFTTSLNVALVGDSCRYGLHNNHFSVHHKNGKTEKHHLTELHEVETVLKDLFHLEIPEKTKFDQRLRAVADF